MSFQIIVVGIAFALMGVAAFAFPRDFVAMIGWRAETADARNEVQAVYGGLGLAIAAVLFSTHWFPQYRDGVVLAEMVGLAGMAGGRVIAALRERPSKWPVVFFILEGGAALLLFSAL